MNEQWIKVEFEKVVEQVLEEMPHEFKKQIENVAVLVEFWPGDEDRRAVGLEERGLLFGLYSGVPKTKRLSSYSSLPDRIKIFAGPILMVSKTWEEIKEKIKDTLLHEIGHHFGLSDHQIYSAQGH